jgi:hypothetical protein
MNNKEQELQEFTIKGELIGAINLTDTFNEVKKIVNHADRHHFHFINSQQEIVSHFDLYRLKENEFPIRIIKTKKTEPYSGDFLDNLEAE